MRVAIGSDHAGLEAKRRLAAVLRSDGHEVTDLGCDSPESCDYPDFATAVAHAVAAGEAERGFLVCGSGVGMAIGANRVPGVRAVQAWSEEIARLSRRHNDANVACFGARVQEAEAIERLARAWLEEPFEGGRHARRVAKLG
jgi:ribose 5-phosphate isomerase B